MTVSDTKMKKLFFDDIDKLCKYLTDLKMGTVHGGFYSWDDKEKGLITTNYGVTHNWPLKAVAFVGWGRCPSCDRTMDKVWDLVESIDGDFVSSWAIGGEPPEEVKEWINKHELRPDINGEVFWWVFD